MKHIIAMSQLGHNYLQGRAGKELANQEVRDAKAVEWCEKAAAEKLWILIKMNLIHLGKRYLNPILNYFYNYVFQKSPMKLNGLND